MKLSCAQLKGVCQFHEQSSVLIGAFLACPTDGVRGPSPLCVKCASAAENWLPDNCTCLADSLQHTADASTFPTVNGKLTR